MYRLVFRKSLIGLLTVILGAAIIYALALPVNPYNDAVKDITDYPILYMVGGEVLFAYLFSAISYRSCPAIQQLGAFFNTLAFICLFGIVGNFTGNQMKLIMDDQTLHFNVISLVMMNILSCMAMVNFFKAEKLSSFADTKVAEEQLGRLKTAKVDPDTQMKWEKAATKAEHRADGRSLRSTMTNLKAISLAEPGQELKPQAAAKAAEAEQGKAETTPQAQATPSDHADAGSLASLLDRIEDEPEAPVQDFAPALSIDAEPKSFAGSSESALADLLDRVDDMEVDTEPTSAPVSAALEDVSAVEFAAEAKPEPVHEAPKQDAPHSPMMGAFKSTSQSKSEGLSPAKPVETATSHASPQAVAESATHNAPVEPAPASEAAASASSTANRLSAMKRRNTSTFTKLQSLSASGQALNPTGQSVDSQMEPDSLKSLLDRLDDDQPQEPAQPLTPPVELVLDHIFIDEATEAAQVEAQQAVAVAETVAPTVAATTAEVEPEATERRSSLSERLAVQPEPALGSLLDRIEEPEAAGEVSASAEAEGGLFEGGVDSDIDNLFSELAPPEAQREVSSQIENFSPAQQEELDESPLFEGGVDKDIDNIFSDLAPPEAQREVSGGGTANDTTALESSSKLSHSHTGDMPAMTVEPAGLAAEEEESDALFAGGVDKDIDNIFSELAPPEAQLEVPHTGTPIQASVQETEEDGGGLFEGGVDSDIDNIFSELAPPEAQKEVKDVLPVKAETVAAIATEEEDDEGGLFTEKLGEDLDNLFSGLTEDKQLEVNPQTLAKVRGSDDPSPKSTGDMPAMTPQQAALIKEQSLIDATPAPAPAPAPVPAPAPAPAPAAASAASPAPAAPKYKEVKEFGRLSSKSTGQLKGAPEPVGTMKTIGKLLLDVHAVENIIKSGETKKIGSGLSTAKIISAARGEGIKNILTTIDTYPGVAGSLIVGHDGLVIASTVGSGWDKDMLGALSTALLSTSNLATKKLEIGKLRQMVMLTKWFDGSGSGEKIKTTVLTDVDVGILAVFLEDTDITKIDGLLDTIHTTIHGG